MKIAYVTSDWTLGFPDSRGRESLAGAGWYRCKLPAEHLVKNGYEAVVVEQIAPTTEGLVVRDQEGVEHDDCDIIVMQRIMNDFGPGLVECGKKAGQIIVNDVDDWFWGLHKDNAAYSASDPELHPTCNRDWYKQTIEGSDLVTVSTKFLADQFAGWGLEVQVIPNFIDLKRWKFRLNENESPTIGWVGGVTHRSGDLETMIGIVEPILDEYDLRFHHSGVIKNLPTAGDIMRVDQQRMSMTYLCTMPRYTQQFDFFDLGIVPLNDIPFNHAKSWIKGLEYAAAGIPFVAQNLPEYQDLHDSYGIGRVAHRAKDWIREIKKLIPLDVRQEAAAANRSALDALSIENNWRYWLDAYESLL